MRLNCSTRALYTRQFYSKIEDNDLTGLIDFVNKFRDMLKSNAMAIYGMTSNKAEYWKQNHNRNGKEQKLKRNLSHHEVHQYNPPTQKS